MNDIPWERFPLVAARPSARAWLMIQAQLGLAPNTILAYGRALEDYFAFCTTQSIDPELASRVHIAAYVHDLTTRPNTRRSSTAGAITRSGLSNATLQQRLTAVRLYYDHLIEEGQRLDHPVGRGHFTPGRSFGGMRARGLIPHYDHLPWILSDEQWQAVLQAAREEPLRNRVMLALAYAAALRREELCALTTLDLDPAHRLLRIRAETTKNRRERMVPYSSATSRLYGAYLEHRRTLSRARGPLFLSESRRNRAQPIAIWTWSKVVERLAERADVPQFSTHTCRHLCLTDLAHAGWDVHEIATFAGHRSIRPRSNTFTSAAASWPASSSRGWPVSMHGGYRCWRRCWDDCVANEPGTIL